jgi:tetratricopeptide (TPR) repeat protein
VSYIHFPLLARTTFILFVLAVISSNNLHSNDKPQDPDTANAARPQRIDPESIALLNRLEEQSNVAFDRGDFQSALDARQKQLKITQKFYGPDDWPNHVSNGWVSALERILELSPADREQITSAQRAFKQAQRMRATVQLNNAIELGSKSLAIYDRLLGKDNFLTLLASQGLAECHSLAGNYAAAKSRLLDDLPRVARQFGSRTQSSAISLHWLAMSERGLGEFEAAEKHIGEAILVFRQLESHGQDERIISSFPDQLLLLAQVQNDRRKPIEAEKSVRECLERLNSPAPLNAPLFGRIQTELARSLSLQGKFQEADDVFSKQKRFLESLSPEPPASYVAPIVLEYARHLRRAKRLREADDQEAVARKLFAKAADELNAVSASSETPPN